MVRKWRNSDRIRLSMINQHIISKEEHRQWFGSIDWERDQYLIFEFRGFPVGLVQFNNIDKITRICEWGFYLGEIGLPRGTSQIMGCLAIEYAFEVLGVISIYGIVLPDNDRSQRYHQKLGFQKDKIDGANDVIDNESPVLLKYVLTKKHWETVKSDLGFY